MRVITAFVVGLAFAWGASAATRSTGVVYFSGDDVEAAFDAGRPLVETSTYKIHASRRTAPGMAEVHTDDTDTIYVLQGSATLVTGGRLVDPQSIGPVEIRGKSIADGETRQLRKGDVVVVPNGTPHWFEGVDGTFLYYVVKVTEGSGR